MVNDNMSIKNELEAILFAWGEPVEVSELARFFDITEDKVSEVIDILIYEYSTRGIRIQRFADKIQMNTSPSCSEKISSFGLKEKRKNLSNAAMEVLSIISYLQPTTKVIIDRIRGVKSDGTIQTLIDRKLIREAGRLKQPGKPTVYKTTDEFLRVFDLENVDMLPTLINREEVMERLRFTEINEGDIEYFDTEDVKSNEVK